MRILSSLRYPFGRWSIRVDTWKQDKETLIFLQISRECGFSLLSLSAVVYFVLRYVRVSSVIGIWELLFLGGSFIIESYSKKYIVHNSSKGNGADFVIKKIEFFQNLRD